MSLDVWCDGSGTIVSGPACIGVVVILAGQPIVEVSEYVGEGTNNLAELRAIRRGLHLAKILGGGPSLPVTVYSDSEYSIGVLTQPWGLRKHVALITAIRQQIRALQRVQFTYVEGHAGILGNEIADWLAGEARRRTLAQAGIVRRAKRRPGEGMPRKRRKKSEPDDVEKAS